METREYKNNQIFILESEDYIEFEDMRILIDDYKRYNTKNKIEIVLLKEKDKPYTQYINHHTKEEHLEIGYSKEESISFLEKKYSLI